MGFLKFKHKSKQCISKKVMLYGIKQLIFTEKQRSSNQPYDLFLIFFMFLLSFLGRLCTAKKKRHNKCKLQRFIEFSFAAYNIVVIQIMINIYGSSFNCKCRPPNMFCFSVIFLYTTQEKVFLKIYSNRWIHFANYLTVTKCFCTRVSSYTFNVKHI